MVGLDGNPATVANSVSLNSISRGSASTASQTCDHKCEVISLSVAIPLLSLLLVGLLAYGLMQRRKEKRESKAKDEEKEIAMRKLGPESEASSVVEGFGDVHAVTDLEEGAEVAREMERPSRSWRPGSLALKTQGWWKL